MLATQNRPQRLAHDSAQSEKANIANELGWEPRETFDTGLRKTVEWYLTNRAWWQRIRSGLYRGERLGVPA